MLIASSNPRLNQLCARWQQVWLLALDRQRKLNDALDRLEEVITLPGSVLALVTMSQSLIRTIGKRFG
jgi:hypothetical protein